MVRIPLVDVDLSVKTYQGKVEGGDTRGGLNSTTMLKIYVLCTQRYIKEKLKGKTQEVVSTPPQC